MESLHDGVQPVDVGSRLRQLRQERGKSMRALARDSGLSTNALSMIERARTSPSVSTLYKIAEALEVPITAFFREEPARQEIVFCKSTNRNRVSFPLDTGKAWAGVNISSAMLNRSCSRWNRAQAADHFGMLHTGHEFCHVPEGPAGV